MELSYIGQNDANEGALIKPGQKETTIISIVIPTYNRLHALRKTLLALNQQTLSKEQFEVILVDDGSEEDVEGLIRSLEWTFPLHLLKQHQLGPAAARNRGASQACGEVILFLDNDMIATPALLNEHILSHQSGHSDHLVAGPRNREYASAGQPLDWLDYRPDGSDFRFEKQPISYQEAFTCNLSIRKQDWLNLIGFREEFKSASFEDIEFAYRASQSGIGLLFAPNALAYHDHPLTLDQRINRAVSYTRTVPLLFQMHPELQSQIAHLIDKEPIDLQVDRIGLVVRKLVRLFLAWRPVLAALGWILASLHEMKPGNKLVKFLYWKVIGGYQLIGLKEGIHLHGWIA